MSLVKTYLSKLTARAKESESAYFYWNPKDLVPTDDFAFWFTMQPCGQNFLPAVVKTVCENAGIQGKTNHSLHATGATQLFAANVPEKLIQKRTGHRSTTALRMYECMSCQQQMSVSSIIASASPKKFVPEILLPLIGPHRRIQHVPRVKNLYRLAFDNCQNCTINVDIQYAGTSTN